MSLPYAFGGVLRKFKACRPTYSDWHFWSWKNATCYVHSLSSCKYKGPSQPPHRKVIRTEKQVNKKNVDRKVYMSDVIRQISNILRCTSWISAQEQLQGLRIKWDSFTVNQVLKSHPPMEKAWLFFNWISKQKGFKHDKFTYTTMLDIFGEARRISSMMYVFQLMQEKGIKIDAITYTSMLHWLSNSGDFDGAVKVWKDMKAEYCHPTVVSYTAYMKVLFDNNRAEEATDIYKEMLLSGLKPTCHTYTILMQHLIHSGKCKSALEVFRKMQETGVQPDKATCNILVEQCSKAGEAWAIIQILLYMKENLLVLRYPVYLQAKETLKMANETDLLLRQVNPHISSDASDNIEFMREEETTCDMNYSIDRGLLIEFLRKKNFAAIDRLYAGIVHRHKRLAPDLVSKIIEANCTHGRIEAAILVLDNCNDMGIYIENEAFLSILGVLIRKKDFLKILPIVEQMVKYNLFPEPQLAFSLIYRLGQARELDIAVKIFKLFPEEIKTTTLYTALISACFSAEDPDKGIATFKTMKCSGIQGATATYNVLIRGLELCGRFNEAKFYRKEKKSLQKDDVPETLLADEKFCDVLFAGYIVP
ncbi:pentatricopeptide repeat-containing protein At2g01390 isoform X2 [Chenopodium quinoa]|uniref:PROP1-like PPR domain-containing protein n=1 Tax=Chenopodium quinoa TaxID=63459 RepID=A0A803L830_CHEQI|nr:pentatricopeptide repeat-containing protein At2g01390 isoform X2 [Chenopodium quinoa]